MKDMKRKDVRKDGKKEGRNTIRKNGQHKDIHK